MYDYTGNTVLKQTHHFTTKFEHGDFCNIVYDLLYKHGNTETIQSQDVTTYTAGCKVKCEGRKVTGD